MKNKTRRLLSPNCKIRGFSGSIDLYLSYFVNSPDWESYLSINEEILIKIREL